MSASVRRIGIVLLCVVVVTAWAPTATAFFPRGGYNSFGQLRYAVWPLLDFDTNNDGDVTAGEGIGFWVEGGEEGFTDEEVEKIYDAFAVWESVPTSYVAFQILAFTQDPIGATDTVDFIPMISLVGTEEEDETDTAKQDDTTDSTAVAELSESLLGTTTVLYTIDDTILTVAGGQSVIIGAGTIVDAEIVLYADAHRIATGEVEAVADLTATTVHALGVLLGLADTPLNNLRLSEDVITEDSLTYLLENEVFYYTDGTGYTNYIGVTPTMFPYAFEVEQSNGVRKQGWADLAPDDISGISWLYPRGSQSGFFAVDHYARTQTRAGAGLPSSPISGAHIVAWADVDDDPQTPRIPLFSTMTGLYEPSVNLELAGKFSLKGLWKQIEMPGQSGEKFSPSYVFTLNELNSTGFERQAPDGFTPDLFDSLQGADPISYSLTSRSASFSTSYPSEVFHEVENQIDISNREAGTPMVWSIERNKVVSADTGKTIPTILPNNEPMFGDPNDVCFFNMIDGGSSDSGVSDISGSETVTSGRVGAKTLRELRNKLLLTSALGTAFVDAYYSLSPQLARFLLQHDQLRQLARKGVAMLYWTLDHAVMVALTALAALALLIWLRRCRQRRLSALLLLLSALLALSGSAQAGMRYMPVNEFVEQVDVVVTGVVASTEAEWRGGRIFTEVVLDVEETVKGDVNKASSLVFSVLGGRVDGMVMSASDIPTFAAGEEVLLYLKEHPGRGYVLYGGLRGKVVIDTDTSSGEKSLRADSKAAGILLALDAKKVKSSSAEGEESRLLLEDFLAYLKGLVRASQEKR